MVDFKDLPKEKKIELIRARGKKEPYKKSDNEKLAESIESLSVVLQKALDKPDTDIKVMQAIMDALKDIKAIIPQAPDTPKPVKTLNVKRKGELGSGNYTVEVIR